MVRKEDDGHYGKVQCKQIMLNNIKLPTRICNIRTKMERRRCHSFGGKDEEYLLSLRH